ncbi:MAG TPA: membrane protein insertase YidC, partial [Terriglobales bacterium]|nr:membrane protein insertase YidC [Terriglobales bacterium]
MAEYHNPQQEPGGDRRMLMVFAVTFALIILGQLFLFRKNPPTQPPSTPAQSTESSQPKPSPAASAPVPAAGQPSPSAATVAVVPKSASSETETTVENSLYRIVFTNRGGQVKSWVLKKYKDDEGRPLDLVNQGTVRFGLPLSLYAYDENLRSQINSALYVPSATGTLHAPDELTFEYASGNITVRKIFDFGETYVIGIETHVTQDGKPVQAYPMWPAALGDEETGPSYAAQKIEYMAEGKVERLAAKKVSGGNTLRGPFNWAGPQDEFFAAIFLPDNPDTAVMVTLRNRITVPKDLKHPDPNEVVNYEVLGAAVGDANGVTRERLFVGPKALNVLES